MSRAIAMLAIIAAVYAAMFAIAPDGPPPVSQVQP